MNRGYSLALLVAIFAVSHLDRHILSISLDAIGNEFSLSDSQLGLISGLMFAIVYVAFGFPIARLAATGNRRNIIAVSAVVWSCCTVVTAAAGNFWHLALARLGVGIGEAGMVPAAHSAISDYYPPERRTSAMATFATGANIGVLLAFLIGGILGQLLGWRWAFVIAGVPGILLAILLRLTVAEPPRQDTALSAQAHRSLFLSTLQTIWNDKGLVHISIGLAITGMLTFGALAWNAAIIIRVHGLSQAQTGIFLALAIGVGGGLGTWLSGVIADWLGKRNPRWRLWIPVIAILAAKPFVFLFLLGNDTVIALAGLAVSATLAAVFWGPTFAFLHSRVSNKMRPMATAIFLFVFNLIGVGVGPTVVGLASDGIFAEFGARSAAYGQLCLQIFGIWGAWHYWQAARQIKVERANP